MAPAMHETRHELAKRELMAIEVACDDLIECESGELWITREGPRDIILAAGESYRAQGREALVVSALRPSVLTLRHPERSAQACREGAESIIARLLRRRFGPQAPATHIG